MKFNFKHFITVWFVSYSCARKTFFANMINCLFFLSLTLTLCIGRIYPYHYYANGIFILTCFLMIVFVLIYGKFGIDRFIILIILLNVLTLVSIIANGLGNDTFTLVILTLGMIPIYLYFKQFKENRKIGIRVLVMSYLVFNSFFLFLYFKDIISFDFSVRLGSKIGNENDVATYLLTGHALYLYFFLKKKYIYILPIAINLLLMLSTGSRSGLLNLLILSIIVVYFSIGRKKKKLFFLSFFLISISLYLMLFLPSLSQLRQRFNDLFLELFTQKNADASTSYRLKLLFESTEFFLRNPIFGGGQNFALNYTFNGSVAHNAFVEIAASYGLFVLIAYICVFLFPLYRANDNYALLKKALIISFLLFFITLSGYYYKPPYLVMPLLATLTDDTTNRSIVFQKTFE